MAKPRGPLESKTTPPVEHMSTEITLALIIHELRAGVYNIKNRASLLSRLLTLPSPPIKQLRECARDIDMSASLAAYFLEDVRALRSSGRDLEPRTSISTTEVNGYIEAVVADIRPRLRRRVEIRTRNEAKANCSVQARARLLTQAFRILIDWASLWALKTVEINTKVLLRQKSSALIVAVTFEMTPMNEQDWQQEISGQWSPRGKRLGIAALQKLANENRWKVVLRRGPARDVSHELVEARLELPVEKTDAGQ